MVVCASRISDAIFFSTLERLKPATPVPAAEMPRARLTVALRMLTSRSLKVPSATSAGAGEEVVVVRAAPRRQEQHS